MIGTEIPSSLDRVEAALRVLDRHVLLDALQEGLSGAAAGEQLAGVGLVATEELEQLYRWRNGTSATVASLDDIQIFPGYSFLSIEEAVANYRVFLADRRWVEGWFPVFANGGGDFYFVDLKAAQSRAVRHFCIDELEYPPEFLSLSAMIQTLAECFERGVFFVDPNGYLEMDDQAFIELAAEMNPDVAYWRELAR
ncbi:hypothetical protein FHX49_000489 [Microbacterium endophyticum]|uniref:Knr4/Smi1-like domain-containing protein n=1 Tax=Microbacterium endophyticum TaxID=1526412 RepID=A0A7W4YLA0_9MICO|nr:SMI1/KNR4 family protein [Microbacterium endophyticum]MBB2974948.1 hypothetical protein [Microbacterium endophyticum]NIK37245.1 hypothetical protein [Microbacterium endophyticum]